MLSKVYSVESIRLPLVSGSRYEDSFFQFSLNLEGINLGRCSFVSTLVSGVSILVPRSGKEILPVF